MIWKQKKKELYEILKIMITQRRYGRGHRVRFNRPQEHSMIHVFDNNAGDFSAYYAAQKWLRDNGYSYGSTDAFNHFVAAQKGEYTLPLKLHNFTPHDMKMVDAVIYSLDFRSGTIEVWELR